MSVNVGRELVPVTTAIIIIYLFIPVLDREKERKTGEREKREKVRREKERKRASGTVKTINTIIYPSCAS